MMTRREAITAAAAGIALAPAVKSVAATTASAGRLNQSVARWCFGSIPTEEFCKTIAEMGVKGVDLLGARDWPIARKYGLTPCMVQGAGGFGRGSAPGKFGPATGWNDKSLHDQLEKTMIAHIKEAAAAKVPNVISLFGTRNGMSDAEGIGNCIEGLNRVKKVAEDEGVTIAIELLNSKVDHHDYIGDHTAFGVAVCKGVDSPRVKLLYDAYHMQIMEGDLIRTIRDNIQYIAHFHFAGVPGRHEPDETQEVNWRAVGTAIADLNFPGYIAHEWIPTAQDPLAALRKAVTMMTV
jgi:hydroxypyruvate isomerase